MSINALNSNYYYGNYATKANENKFAAVYNNNNLFATYSPAKDGCDDGKISTGSKVKNFFKGIGNTIKGALKSLATPKGFLKAAACVLLCTCTGPAAPVFMAAFGAIGVAKGASTLIKGASAASKATTDAEAEAAWQNIGSGTFQVGISVAPLKAGIRGIQAQGGLMATMSATKSAALRAGANVKALGMTAKGTYQLNRAFGNGVKDSASAAAKDVLNDVGVDTAAISAKAAALKSTAQNTYQLNRAFGNGVIKSGYGAAKDVLTDVGVDTAAISSKFSGLKSTAQNTYQLNRAFGNGVIKSGYGAAKDVLTDVGSSISQTAIAGNLSAAASMVKEAVAGGMSYSQAIAQTASALGVTPQQVAVATTGFVSQF